MSMNDERRNYARSIANNTKTGEDRNDLICEWYSTMPAMKGIPRTRSLDHHHYRRSCPPELCTEEKLQDYATDRSPCASQTPKLKSNSVTEKLNKLFRKKPVLKNNGHGIVRKCYSMNSAPWMADETTQSIDYRQLTPKCPSSSSETSSSDSDEEEREEYLLVSEDIMGRIKVIVEFYKEQAVESMDSMEGVPSNYRGGRRPCVISGLDLGDQVEEHQPFEDSNTKSYPGDLVLTSAQPLRHPSPPTVNGGTNDHYGSEGSLAEAGSNTSQTPPKDDGRRISVRDFFKTKKGKKTTADLEHVLITMKSTEFRDLSLASHRHSNWQTVLASESNPNASISDVERNRRDAVWEIFTNECIFLVDHLSVLRHCFMEPLKNCQVEGLLMEVEPNKLFGNLNELISLSYRFCREFFSALRTTSQSDFASTSSLCDCLDTMTLNSRDGSIYHSYLLNYRSALTYLDILRNTLEDYTFFERFCEQDSRCKKLRLSDLLVAPMQHWTRLPLILERVRKYTTSQSEIDRLIASTEKVRSSLKSLENKIEWLKTFERVKQIEKQLIWPAITEVDTKTYIPESLRPILRAQKTDNLLDDKVREITMEGPLMLTEKDNRTVDTYIFLFTDFLLFTKLKKKLKGRASTINKNEGFYHVLKQPIPVNSLSVHDIGATEASTSGMKNMFVVIQRNSFQQVVGVFTLQAHTALGKEKWLKHIRDNKERTVEINNNDLESQKTFRDSQETNYNSSMAHKFDKNFLKNSQVLEITHSATLPRNMERSQNHNLLHPNSPSLDESMPAATRQRLMFDKSRTLSTGCLSSDHSLLLLNGNL